MKTCVSTFLDSKDLAVKRFNANWAQLQAFFRKAMESVSKQWNEFWHDSTQQYKAIFVLINIFLIWKEKFAVVMLMNEEYIIFYFNYYIQLADTFNGQICSCLVKPKRKVNLLLPGNFTYAYPCRNYINFAQMFAPYLMDISDLIKCTYMYSKSASATPFFPSDLQIIKSHCWLNLYLTFHRLLLC